MVRNWGSPLEHLRDIESASFTTSRARCRIPHPAESWAEHHALYCPEVGSKKLKIINQMLEKRHNTRDILWYLSINEWNWMVWQIKNPHGPSPFTTFTTFTTFTMFTMFTIPSAIPHHFSRRPDTRWVATAPLLPFAPRRATPGFQGVEEPWGNPWRWGIEATEIWWVHIQNVVVQFGR